MPVLAMSAPMCRVLPPAPAQKSTTISLALRLEQQRQQLAAFVLHLEPALLEAAVLNSGARSLAPQADRRIRRGFAGKSFLRQPCVCTSSRVALRVLTRRSTGAGRLSASASRRVSASAASGVPPPAGRSRASCARGIGTSVYGTLVRPCIAELGAQALGQPVGQIGLDVERQAAASSVRARPASATASPR